MGSRLRRELREVLPASIKGLQRAIALELADDARYDDGWRYSPEHGRRSKARLADLVRWTGAKDELSVREMLRRLAVAGWEFRLPIGTGKDGRPLYAVPGQAMQFRVPDFKAPTLVGPSVDDEPEGPTVVGSMGAEGPTVVGEGPTTVGEGPTVVAEGPTTVGPPSPLHPFTSHRDPTSSSPAEPAEPDAADGGGGGDSDLRSIADHITAHLDYQGKPPGNRLRKTITDRLVAALDSGWSVDGLAFYLDLGSYRPDSAAAVYAAKLAPAELPAAEPVLGPAAAHGGVFGPLSTAAEIEAATVDSVFGPARRDTADGGLWDRAMRRANERMGGGPRPGTDTTVAGWGAVARQLREPHRPYSNDDWHRPADPFEALKIPWCGDPDCDPVTRLKPGVTPQDEPDPCGACHPMMRF